MMHRCAVCGLLLETLTTSVRNERRLSTCYVWSCSYLDPVLLLVRTQNWPNWLSHHWDTFKVAITIAIRLWFDCDVVIKITIRLRFGFNLTRTKNEHFHFFVTSRGVVYSTKAVVGAYNDVIVYLMAIGMAFTLPDQHRVASFNCRRWYSYFTYSK